MSSVNNMVSRLVIAVSTLAVVGLAMVSEADGAFLGMEMQTKGASTTTCGSNVKLASSTPCKIEDDGEGEGNVWSMWGQKGIPE